MQDNSIQQEVDIVRWVRQMLEAIDYLHGLNPAVLPRDITPKNIIIHQDGHAVLIDFGTVQAALRSEASVSSTSAGTFGYAASDPFVGRDLPQSNLDGLGMTFLDPTTGDTHH